MEETPAARDEVPEDETAANRFRPVYERYLKRHAAAIALLDGGPDDLDLDPARADGSGLGSG